MTRRNCRHENADHLMPGMTFEPWVSDDVAVIRSVAKCEQLRCLDCEAWLPLGPSDEHASEQVEIEIRAAEIAAVFQDTLKLFHCEGCESCGWTAYEWNDRNAPSIVHRHNEVARRGFYAGYLAREIFNHKEPTR
jgi:uncharacterized protein with PIN domain